MLLVILLSSLSAKTSALFTGGCPTVSVSQSGFGITGATQIEPGAYTQLGFGVAYSFPTEIPGVPDTYDACDQSNYPAPQCPVYIVAQPAGLSCPDASSVGSQWADLQSSPPSGYAYDQAWACSGSTPYNYLDGNHDGTCIVNPYYGADLAPGYYQLCAYIGIAPESTSNPWRSVNPPAACSGFQWFQIQPDQSLPQNILIDQSVLPNTASGSFSLTTLAPLTLTVDQVMQGITAPQTNFIKGDEMQISLSGDGAYPTYLEIAEPGAGVYCQYGGVPTTQSQDAPGTVASTDKVPLCPSYAPASADLPCVIAYSGGPNTAPTDGNIAPVQISTANLAASTYSICGYEGNQPGLSSSSDPWSVFFAQQDFEVQCLPGDLTCGNINYIQPGPSASAAIIQTILCSAYYQVQALLAILALVLILIGAATYAVSYSIPGQMRGTIQGYAMGLVLAGIISLVIVGVSVYTLSFAANTTVGNILALNGCTP